ncbi:MAG: hypothetical protein LBC94_08405 [Desulfovibrio sp.]|jgi:hypothetical protein|nr:hypothetical protein [Desulfovibrio sp.]
MTVNKPCVLVIPDAGPLISLQKAGYLELLLRLEMPILVVDAIYYELVIDTEKYDSDKEIRNFLKKHAVRHKTDIGEMLLEKRLAGEKTKHLGEAAILEFLNNDVDAIAGDNPVLLLFEDHRMVATFKNVFPPTVHLLSTIGFLRGLEQKKLLTNAKAVIQIMQSAPSGRFFPDLPYGTDIEARGGSSWLPEGREADKQKSQGKILKNTSPEDFALAFLRDGLDPRADAGEIEKHRPDDAGEIRGILRDMALSPEAHGLDPELVEVWGEALGLGRTRTSPGPNGPVVQTVYDDF